MNHSNLKFFFAIHRDSATATALPFQTWEDTQNAFRFGIELPNGKLANGIGRCRDRDDFTCRARQSGFHVV